MSKFFIIADFFVNQILGGGELCNDELGKMLSKAGNEVVEGWTPNVTIEWLNKNVSLDDNLIIGNFIRLSEDVKRYLKRYRYVIYEHDHKYLASRNPSSYPNYLAPDSDIINKDFYKNAIAVFCQSKMHADIAKKNLKLDNIVSLGGNLWSEKILDLIEEYSKAPKVKENGVVESQNRIKGQFAAVNYCKANLNNSYELFSDSNYESFLKKMAMFKNLVFFPETVETFSRLVVEARMLGLKVITNNKVGATSESWFPLKGKELIDKMREKRGEILQSFLKAFKSVKNLVSDLDDNITVILNLYRRPSNLQLQINSIRAQTIKPKEIWIWKNYHEDNSQFNFESVSGVDKWFDSNHNWKFYGRFAAAQLAQTKYIAIFDDDTIPGPDWFLNCLETSVENRGILGGIGIELNDQVSYANHQRYGWATQNENVKQVDLVGHAWFFEKQWLKHLWMEEPPTWDNGEDIQFSYLAQKYGGISTFVPPHSAKFPTKSSSLLGYQLGVDSVATSTPANHGQFYSERDLCVQNAIAGGWKTVKMG